MIKQDNGKEKILLGIAPFWSPLTPPMGIASLKSFLEPYGYEVKTVDMNVEDRFKEMYNRYFKLLGTIVPMDKQGNLHNIGHDVMQNHMMAHIHYTDEGDYIRLVKDLVNKIFYFEIQDRQVREINRLFDDFYLCLKDYITGLLEEEKPGVFGLTAYCGNLPATMYACKVAKEKEPGIKTLVGGGIFSQQLALNSPNLDFFMEKTPYIDKLFVGEGQHLLLKYLQGKLPDSKRLYTSQDAGGATVELARVNIPDLSDLDLRKYVCIGVSGSRSCPNKCSFCNSRVFWGDYVKRDMSYVVKEMAALQKMHNVQMFYMSDSLLNPTIADLSTQLIEADVSVYFDGYLRVFEPDTPPVTDIDNTLAWRRGGFYRARMGCETGSERMLDVISKNITIRDTKEAVTSLAYAGIKTTTYFVVGIPGETEDDFQQTLNLLTELKNNIYQAECAAFIYYYSGQNKSDDWADKRKLVYPAWAKDMLVTETWLVDVEPRREVVYDRLNRFVDHIRKLGIPNPFTLKDIHQADVRWKKLHKNAVPSLLEVQNSESFVDERKNVKMVYSIKNSLQDEGEFGF